MAQQDRNGATTAQLRDDIDRGRTGDKVDFGDPAAAPLGTDDEVAGTPPKPDDVAMARALERQSAPERTDHGNRSGRVALVAMAVVIAVAVILAIALG